MGVAAKLLGRPDPAKLRRLRLKSLLRQPVLSADERQELTDGDLADRYDALLARVRMAEHALYRATLLAAEAEEARSGRRHWWSRQRPMTAQVLAYTRAFVDPLLPVLRETLGYTEGDAYEWYGEAGSVAAELLRDHRFASRALPMPDGWRRE